MYCILAMCILTPLYIIAMYMLRLVHSGWKAKCRYRLRDYFQPVWITSKGWFTLSECDTTTECVLNNFISSRILIANQRACIKNIFAPHSLSHSIDWPYIVKDCSHVTKFSPIFTLKYPPVFQFSIESMVTGWITGRMGSSPIIDRITGWYFKLKNHAKFRYVWTVLQCVYQGGSGWNRSPVTQSMTRLLNTTNGWTQP